MKKLAFLPIALMIVFSGCNKQAEIAKPNSDTNISNLRSGECPELEPVYIAYPSALDDMLNNCPYYEICEGDMAFRSSAQYYHIYDHKSQGPGVPISLPNVETIVSTARNFGYNNRPSSGSCSGTIITRYFFTPYFTNGIMDGYNLTVSYYCCTSGGGGID